MICNCCKKNVASIKFTEVVDGVAVQHLLCPDCYAKRQVEMSGFSMEVPKPSRTPVIRPRSDSGKLATVRCPVCTTSLEHLLEQSDVGCPSCYGVFEKEIASLLGAFHRGTSHCGKKPQGDDDQRRISDALKSRRLLLRSMLKTENYEEAARLRDEITHLETAFRAAQAGGVSCS